MGKEFKSGYSAANRLIEKGWDPEKLKHEHSEPDRFIAGWNLACEEVIEEARMRARLCRNSPRNPKNWSTTDWLMFRDILKNKSAEEIYEIIHEITPTLDLSDEAIKNAKFESLQFKSWEEFKESLKMNAAEKPEVIVDKNGKVKVETPKLKKGLWYKCENVLAVFQGVELSTYGYNTKSKLWYEEVHLNWDKDGIEWQPATETEVAKILIDEAWNRYDGEKIDVSKWSLTNSISYKDITAFEYFAKYKTLKVTTNKRCSYDIFRNGEWARIADKKEEPSHRKLFLKKKSTRELYRFIEQITNELKNRL